MICLYAALLRFSIKHVYLSITLNFPLILDGNFPSSYNSSLMLHNNHNDFLLQFSSADHLACNCHWAWNGDLHFMGGHV
jgi:hypothetical protein